jgi:hypothetical protein
MRRCKCGRDLGRYARDLFLEIQVALWSAVIVLSVCALMIGPGCTAYQLAALEDGLVSLGDCSLYSSVGCASQAMAGCATPDESGDWNNYGSCLAEKSMGCASSALARCSYRAIAAAVGGPVVMGGTGCKAELDKVKSCVNDTEIETEAEAVQAVAWCQRFVCQGESEESE